MKKILLIALLFFSATTYAQNTDSLTNLIFKEKTDTARIRRHESGKSHRNTATHTDDV